MSEVIVEMKHVTKRFPGIVANDDISLQVHKGEILAILGENGAGKSTLMSILFGMYEPDEGEILIRGKKERISSPSYATGLNIGMVHQHFKLVRNYTVTENIILGLPCKDRKFGILPYVDLKKADEKVRELSARYGLEVNPTDVIENIGVSVRQRVEILKMLYREAEILIFDEPTSVLTPQEIRFLLDIIRRLRDKGKTIILITHKLEEIKRVADRCAILNRGRLVAVKNVSETSTHEMARLMVGREVSFETEKAKASPGETVLEVRNLTVWNRDRFPLVKNVSLAVRAGEILAVAGVSGNGQVELADAIAGLEKRTEGEILLKGQDLSSLSIRERTLKGMAYIPEDRQEFGLILDFSLAENLVMKTYFRPPFSHKGILNHRAIEENGRELITRYDIRGGREGKAIVRSMSGGNQQKAIIGRELELNSDLLIFVFPTQGLDIGAIENIHRQMIEARDAGKAVLLISLELDEIMSCADTIAVIYNGEIQKIAPAGTLTKEEIGEFMMGVKAHAEA